LCDFGLCDVLKDGELLTSFCGSPGFFAPEMVTSEGGYVGDKADMWSIGCILLEMVLGHEKFCDAWMAAYDYETLKDPNVFGENIKKTVDNLPSVLCFSPHLNDFILKLLVTDLTRLSAAEALKHPWMECMYESSDLTDLTDREESVSPKQSGDSAEDEDSAILVSKSLASLSVNTKSKVTENGLEISNRERKLVEGYNEAHSDIHLPPIEPATPSMGRARKILKKGAAIVDAANTGNWSNIRNDSDSPLMSPKTPGTPIN